MRFQSSGWKTKSIDGHNENEIREALTWAQTNDAPTLIACKTTIGFGAPSKAGTSASHGSPLGVNEVEETRKKLNWPHAAFEIPDDIRDIWMKAATRHIDTYAEWKSKTKLLSLESLNLIEGIKEDSYQAPLKALKQTFLDENPNQATRIVSQRVLDAISPTLSYLVGGSADLTGSNNTKANDQKPINGSDFSGSYIYFGVREHAMAAIMNGLSLYGFTPYGGTFLVFSDYLRPALRCQH